VTQVPSPSDKQLLNIRQLVDDEKYRETLEVIEKLRKRKLDKGNQMRIGVLESRCLTGLGECSRAFKVAQAVAEEGMNLPEYKTTVIDALLETAAASDRFFRIDTLFEACDRAEILRQQLPTDDESLLESIRSDILHHKSLGFRHRSDVRRGIDCALESLSIRERLGPASDIASSYLRVAFHYLTVDNGKALQYIEKACKLNEELDRKGYRIHALLLKAVIDRWEGNYEEAEQGLLQGLDLAREHDIGYFLVPVLRNLGGVYAGRGDSQSAERVYKECLTLSERDGAGQYIAICTNNLGEVYRFRGDFDEALKRYERAIQINKSMGRMTGYVTALLNSGLIQYATGDLNEAIRFMEEALAISKERKDAGPLTIGASTLYSVMVLVDNGMTERAQKYVEDLIQIVDKGVEKGIKDLMDQICRLSAAIVLKPSVLARDRALAKEHLAAIVNGTLIDYEVTSMALLMLCDLLVEDLRLHGDKGVLDELKVLLASFAETIVGQGKTSLHVEALLLQSKVALVELDLEEANRLLDLARIFANEKGLERMLKLITDERDTQRRELTLWEQLGEDIPPMAKRTEKVRIHEQIEKMIREGSWRKMLF